MGSVGYLLDTHTFLWAVHDESKLSNATKRAIIDNPSKVRVSAVSAYEIMNKYRLGKLPEYAHAISYNIAFIIFSVNNTPSISGSLASSTLQQCAIDIST